MSYLLFADEITNTNKSPTDSIEDTIRSLRMKLTSLDFLNGYLKRSYIKLLEEILFNTNISPSKPETPISDSKNDSFFHESSEATASSANLENLTQITTPCVFDFSKIRDLVEADFSTWKVDHDDKQRKVYSFTTKGSSELCVRSEMVVPDGDVDILSQMHINLDIRKEWDTSFRKMRVVQTFSEKEDIIHHELKMPFPLSSRDFVHCRYYLNSESHREELERLGIAVGSTKCCVILQHSTVLESCPVVKGVERAENITVSIFEEDSEDSKLVHVKTTSKTDLKGTIPSALLQTCIGIQTLKNFEAYLAAFRKNQDKWKQLLQKD